MSKKKTKLVPNTKVFKVKDLRNMEVPDFQRWIVERNLKELKSSIEEIGLLRCPVVVYVKEEKKNFIIDGNHIRTILIENNSDDSEVTCIYREANDLYEAAVIFRLLNIRGKKLDWVDITNLYMHTSIEKDSIYKIVWNFLGNPNSPGEVKRAAGFSVPTIIEMLCGSKPRYKEGKSTTNDVSHFVLRKNLLSFLMYNAPEVWRREFENKSLKKPSGGSIIGFANYWFKNKLHETNNEEGFLRIVNDICKKYSKDITSGKIILSRDNAGRYMEEYFETFKEDAVTA